MANQTPSADGFDPQSFGLAQDSGPPNRGFRLRKALEALRRLWWVPISAIGFGLISGVIWFFLAPPTFVCKAALWETEKMKLPEGATFSEDQQNYMGTQIELLRSEKMKEAAWDRLRSTGTNTIPLGRRGKPYEVDLRLIQPPKSTLIFLEASSPYPAYTQAFLDALLNEYLDYKKGVRKVVSGDTLSSISEQVLRLERELKENQEGLTAFQRTNNLAVLHEEGTIAGTHLAQLKTRLSDLSLESKLLEASALEKEAATTNGAAALMGPMSLGEREGTAASQSGLAERQMAFKDFELLRIQREKLAKYLRPKHPRMIRINDEIERAQKIIDLYRSQTQDQLAASRSALKMKAESVQVFIRDAEIKVEDANARIAEGERLKLNVARIQSLYDRLVLLLQNVDISRNVDQSTTAVLQNASEPKRSYRQDVTAALRPVLLSTALGFGIILLVSVRDDRFNSIKDVNERFGEVIVGQVPELAVKRNGTLSRSVLLEKDDDRHVYAESYRNLRSAIHFLPVAGERPRLLLITSAVPGEGKSSIAVNLARAMAMGGSRVLLIDGDMRKGRLHELLKLQREPGLAELLRGSGTLETSLQTDSCSGLAFLPRGGDTSNPGDLILSPACARLLNRVRAEYDYVVIDSCPVFAADDVTTLAPKADATLFVVSRGFSRARTVSEALDLLQQRQAKLLGLVLNRADTSAHAYNFYKYAEYYPASRNGAS